MSIKDFTSFFLIYLFIKKFERTLNRREFACGSLGGLSVFEGMMVAFFILQYNRLTNTHETCPQCACGYEYMYETVCTNTLSRRDSQTYTHTNV